MSVVQTTGHFGDNLQMETFPSFAPCILGNSSHSTLMVPTAIRLGMQWDSFNLPSKVLVHAACNNIMPVHPQAPTHAAMVDNAMKLNELYFEIKTFLTCQTEVSARGAGM
jgi:hypothetical protein